MTIAYCGIGILVGALLLLFIFFGQGRRTAGVAALALSIALVLLLGDVHFTGKRQIALVACGTSASAAEHATSCPFR
jgi:hypothetical protein